MSHQRETLINHLERIEGYMRGCEILRYPRESSPLRTELAKFLQSQLPETLELWLPVISKAFGITPDQWDDIRYSMHAAQIRWFHHIENPSDSETYAYLREHTRGESINRFPASRFLTGQLKFSLLLRDAVIEKFHRDIPHARRLVALLDQEIQERQLHITDFFIESRIEQLNEQEERYRQAAESAPAAIFQITFEEGIVTNANQGAERLTGKPREELIGRLIWELHPPDERTRAREHWLAARREGHSAMDDLHLLGEDERAVPVFVSSGVIEYGQNRFIQRICLDRSERRHLERQLVQSEKMAAIGQLAAGVAHEIRNPLNGIRMALYDLREILNDASSEATDDLRIAEEELERAKQIIDNLLEFSRVSHVDTEPVDLNDLLAKTLILMHRYLRNNNVEVKTDLSKVPFCMANENEMRQVVLNLVTNAVQAMPQGGCLTLHTSKGKVDKGNAPHVILEVSDSGIGIPTENLKDIFNPFYTTKAPGQGTGLGLSVVDSIVRRNQGEIQVESQLGRGTTFRLELPCNCEAS